MTDDNRTPRELFAAQFTGSPAMAAEIHRLLREAGAPALLGEGGRSVYSLLHVGYGPTLRKRIREASLQSPGETFRLRWWLSDALAEDPDEAYVRDGAFIYPEGRNVDISWTGPWPDMDVREQVSAALEEMMVRLEGIPGAEGARVVLEAGDARAHASVSHAPGGFHPDLGDDGNGAHVRYFEKLLKENG
ncbi:MAG TPA: hypothetical protein VLA21_03315 [Candidatus Limnocylindria bacterium]|nr:hypothetical protein [Candidatus Limnocylindria bacterium]